MRNGGIYARVSLCYLQLVSESEKAENGGTNKVEPDLKKRVEIAEPEKKDEISSNTNIDHIIDDMFAVIKNTSNEPCPEVQQPTENEVS